MHVAAFSRGSGGHAKFTTPTPNFYMSAIHNLNPKAEHARRGQALEINISAAEAIMEVMKTNFGPAGTLKMLIGGAGDIMITKDGAVLLD